MYKIQDWVLYEALMSSHTVNDLLLKTCRHHIFLSVSGCVALVKSWHICRLQLLVYLGMSEEPQHSEN